jgi:hypothetical protein
VPIVVPMGTLIRLTAILASVFIALGFATFAVDELNKGSQTQQQALSEQLNEQVSPSTAAALAVSGEEAREQQHGDLREAIDDVDDVLLGPFDDLVGSSNVWVEHGLPALLGLLLYGVGLGMLANFLPKQNRASGDWRTA